MERIANPMSIEVYPGRRAQVYIHIKYENNRLSITGVEEPMRDGGARGGCGQIDMHLVEDDRSTWKYNPRWNDATMDRLLEIWDRWHLNDMKAGTPQQGKFIREWKEAAEDLNALNHYDRVCAALREAGLYVAEHPEQMTWGVGRGYRYGTAWLSEEVPKDVVKWLFSLPPTTRTPAWV